MKLIILILLTLLGTLSAREISNKYYEGQNLIYDCENKHFACVDGPSLAFCLEERQVALYEGHENVPCNSIKSFSSLVDCTEKQLQAIEDNLVATPSCRNSEFK